MIINDNVNMIFNNRNKHNGTKLFKLPIKKIKIQSRNNNINNNLTKVVSIKNNNSLYSTKEGTPRKEYNQVITHSGIDNNCQQTKEKKEKYELDDSLSQISQILNSDKNDLNYSGLIGKIPGINEETNFVYDQILFNKSKINKAKLLSHKIGVLKLPSKISSKEGLSNSGREKKCFSDRVQERGNHEENKKNNNNKEDYADIFCCFFRSK